MYKSESDLLDTKQVSINILGELVFLSQYKDQLVFTPLFLNPIEAKLFTTLVAVSLDLDVEEYINTSVPLACSTPALKCIDTDKSTFLALAFDTASFKQAEADEALSTVASITI